MYAITLASPSSWRIITAGIPRLAWRILSCARSTRRWKPTVTVITRTWPVASRWTVRRLPAIGDLAQPVAEPVDAGERGEGVVDRRRERADGDLHELIDREREILRERPVRARGVRAAERSRDAGRGGGGPDVAPGAGPRRRSGRGGAAGGSRRGCARRSRSACPCARTAGSRCPARGRRRCPRRVARSSPTATVRPSARRLGGRRAVGLDRPREVAGDARDDLRQLDRLGDVIDEQDEHARRPGPRAPSSP